MTTVFDTEGRAVAVTLLELPPNRVAQVKTRETDGYTAVQLGLGAKKRPTKAETGHVRKAGIVVPVVLKEFKTDGDFVPGGECTVTLFDGVRAVDVTARSKGRGFAGVIKRHGFSRGPKTHGCKAYRRPKSSGPSTTPAEVRKGKKMPGHLGDAWVTTRNLKVYSFDVGKSLLVVEGAVAGRNGAVVMVYPTNKRRRSRKA